MSEEKTTEPENEAAAAADGDAAVPARPPVTEDGAADEPPGAEPAVDGAHGTWSRIVPKFAIVIAVLASLIAGALWWQYRQFYVELANEDQALGSRLEEIRAGQRALGDDIDGVQNSLDASDARILALEDDLAALPAEIRALERRVEALQGGRLDAREIWLREQAEYYLVLANTEARLGQRIDNAIEALELADDVLRELGDPALADVRRAIAAELQSLRAVDRPDLDRLLLDLRGLLERVPELPMRAETPDNFGSPDTDLEDAEPGLGRLLERTQEAVTSLVRVERQDGPVEQLLSQAERRVVRRQLALELQLARTAVLEARQADFRQALVAADGILNRDFNREARSVIAARELLAGMMRIELAPAIPDIGDSLGLLRNAPGVD